MAHTDWQIQYMQLKPCSLSVYRKTRGLSPLAARCDLNELHYCHLVQKLVAIGYIFLIREITLTEQSQESIQYRYFDTIRYFYLIQYFNSTHMTQHFKSLQYFGSFQYLNLKSTYFIQKLICSYQYLYPSFST